MYAIVRAGGRQEKVAVGDVVEVDRLAGEPGLRRRAARAAARRRRRRHHRRQAALAKVTRDRRGRAATKGPKIDILKYKNKTGYRKRIGPPQQADARCASPASRPGSRR